MDGSFYRMPQAKWELENFANETQITAGARRSIQHQYRESLQKKLTQDSSGSFLFGPDPRTTFSDAPLVNNSESFYMRSGHSLFHDEQRSQFFIQDNETNRIRPQDLKVFDFVDSTKRLIQKGWNRKLFRKHKLATYNWSFQAPVPLMDSKYFCQVAIKDVLEPEAVPASTLIAGRSIFTPKYGVTARDTLRESAGILFFTKDIDFDYQTSLSRMRHLYPNLVSGRYYVPFVTFVRALRQTRCERGSRHRVTCHGLLMVCLWLCLVGLLASFTMLIAQERPDASYETPQNRRNVIILDMISAPVIALILGLVS